MLFSVPGNAADTIRIGLSAPITGNYAEFGENFKYAVQMAVDEINAQGGLLGKQIEVVVMDSKGDPKEAATIAQKFVQDKTIVAEIGDFTSTCCLAAAPIYERYGMVQLSPTSSHPDFAPSGKYMFGIVGTQDAEGPFNVKYIAQQHLGFAISSIGTIPRTSKRSGYTHSLTCNLSSSSSQVTILCGNPTVKCFSS
jgi:branched-chain amino acid transport system substrate-binding protein